LFLCCGFLGLVWLSSYVEKQKLFLLILAGVAIILAFMTRYAGAAFVGTGVLGIWLLSSLPLTKRLRDCLILVTISCGPLLLWLVRNMLVSEQATNRTLAFHPISFHHLKLAVSTFSLWLLPANVPGIFRLGLTALFMFGLGVSLYVMWRRHDREPAAQATRWEETRMKPLLSLNLIFVAQYVILLFLTISFLDAHTKLDYRMLSPVHMAALPVVIVFFARCEKHCIKKRSLRISVTTVLLLLAVFYLGCTLGWINNHQRGFGYASEEWRQSDLLRQVRTLPAETTIFSNGYHVIYILTHRNASFLPLRFDANSGKKNEHYEKSLQEMREKMVASNGVIVYFDTIIIDYVPTKAELRSALPLLVRYHGQDGVILGLK